MDWKKLARKAAKWLGREIKEEIEAEVDKRRGPGVPPGPGESGRPYPDGSLPGRRP